MSRINILQELMPSLWQGTWSPSSIRKHLFPDERYSVDVLCEMIMNSDGEYSSLLISERILNAYEKLDDAGLLEFFTLLNERYDLDVDDVRSSMEAYTENQDAASLKRLTTSAEPRRQELFRRLNLAPGGTRRLVRMREKLLMLAKGHPELMKMDADFRHLFSSWFNRGFLLMHPVDWTTPAHILEKIIAYEAVHEIRNWEELRNRLEPPDRYCYAFFHPAMEDEPLVFVEVALTESVPDSIGKILNRNGEHLEPDHATCAIFYSISSCHAGLAGVSFGNFLIKQVATSLKQRFPDLKRFATISPAPGFRRWLDTLEKQEVVDAIRQTYDRSEPLEEDVNDSLLHYAASYFLEQKSPAEEPIDPVARFHLKNGARLERLNPHADRSDKGMEQSFGLMVNYIYNLARVEENHENYMKNHKVVCSSAIKRLLSKGNKGINLGDE